MRKLLEKLGQNPERSVAIFAWGVGLFLSGALLIALGYYQHYLWQLPGLFFLAIGGLTSAWGYVGIFANRLLVIFSRLNH